MALQREAADGVDPRGRAKEAVAAAISLSQLINDYARLHLEPNVKSGTKILSILRNRHLHFLQARLVGDISKREFIDAIDLVMADGTPTAASNLLRNLKMLLNWAVQRDSIAINVLQGVRAPSKAVERDRVLTDIEICDIWRATFKLPTPYGEMFRMFFLTGQRRSEVATMRWDDVVGDLWTIPRERVKKDRPHAVPLGPSSLQILVHLSQRPRSVAGGFVFTTDGGKRPSSNFNKMKILLDDQSSVSDWRIHDIRRTVRSKLAELGIAREVARKVLNHEDGKVDRIYNRHEYLAEKREALCRLERHILGLMGS